MEEVEEEGEVPRAVGNGDAPKKQRKSGRLGANNGGNALERSFTLRDRDKAAHVREIGKQELAISGTNEGENERETREKRKRNLPRSMVRSKGITSTLCCLKQRKTTVSRVSTVKMSIEDG